MHLALVQMLAVCRCYNTHADHAVTTNLISGYLALCTCYDSSRNGCFRNHSSDRFPKHGSGFTAVVQHSLLLPLTLLVERECMLMSGDTADPVLLGKGLHGQTLRHQLPVSIKLELMFLSFH